MRAAAMILLAMSACVDYPHVTVREYAHETCSGERLARFIVDCSAAANPKSDEEGEDLVKQCEATGRGLFCKRSLERTKFVQGCSGCFIMRAGEPIGEQRKLHNKQTAPTGAEVE